MRKKQQQQQKMSATTKQGSEINNKPPKKENMEGITTLLDCALYMFLCILIISADPQGKLLYSDLR